MWSRTVVALALVSLCGVLGCGADAEGAGRGRPASGDNAAADVPAGNGADAIIGGTPPGGSVTPIGNMMPVGAAGMPAMPSGGAVSMREPVSVDACADGNAAGLDAAGVAAIKAGGPAGAMRWLYPYEATVFPRGMLAPTLMWEGAGAAAGDVVYVHIKSSLFDYHGCLVATGPGQLQLPQEVWQQAGDQTTGPGDPFTIELTSQGGSGIAGPITLQVVIAQATLKGSIFYNSYVSSGSGQGSVYRIPPGGQAQLFLGGAGCYGCHAVSANGERMISHVGFDPGASYGLSPTTQPNPPQLSAAPGSAFSGLSPDGTVYVASAHPPGLVRPQGTPFEAILSNDAALFETDSGAMLAGSGIPAGAMMPIFSPDATMIAFNDFAAGAGRSLSVMDFDLQSRTASNARVVFTDSAQYPGWPFFLPDGQALVFARGDNSQFSGAGAGVLDGLSALAPASDLHIVDLASGTSTLLARAMGLNTPQDSTGYGPFGAEDLHKHYYPTVSPVSAGGYYWLFFDTIRHYGNQGSARQLWGSAITISADGSYTGDPSHPAFYLTGQELGTGNHRAFAALDPCKADGERCETGIDCCSGFCTDGICGPPEEERCSETNEACETSADCCNPSDVCIGGFCGQILVE